MNKDNKELIKQYQLIKEAFEPDTSPESGVVGSAKGLFDFMQKHLNDVLDEEIPKRVKAAPLYFTYEGDATNLRQNMENLFNNILKHAAEEGEYTLEYWKHPVGEQPRSAMQAFDDGVTGSIHDLVWDSIITSIMAIREILDILEKVYAPTLIDVLDTENLKKILTPNFNERG